MVVIEVYSVPAIEKCLLGMSEDDTLFLIQRKQLLDPENLFLNSSTKFLITNIGDFQKIATDCNFFFKKTYFYLQRGINYGRAKGNNDL